MAHAWITKFKHLLDHWRKFREGRASTQALTSHDHSGIYFKNNPDQRHDGSAPLEADNTLPPSSHRRSHDLIPHPADARAQPLRSSLFPPRSDTTTSPTPLKNVQQDKAVQPRRRMLSHTPSEHFNHTLPTTHPRIPVIVITCPSTISTVYPDNVSPLISPILPALPRLDTQIPRQTQSQVQRFRRPHPDSRQRYHPSRPAPRPPRQLRKPRPNSRPLGHEAASLSSTSSPCRRMAFRKLEVEGNLRGGEMSAYKRAVEGAEGEEKATDKRRALHISSPIPGSFSHVDGAFLGRNGED